MPAPQNKILVIRGGAIGDFILTLPVCAALRAQFPNTGLELLGYPHIAQLAQAGNLVDATHSIEARALAGFFARRAQLDANLGAFFASFAIIISYLYDPDKIFQENVARVSKAQFIAGPHRPDERAGIHAGAVFLQPLTRLAIFDADPVPRLNFASASSEPVVALHPGSGSEKKNWPEAKWRALIEKLAGVEPLPPAAAAGASGPRTTTALLLVGGEAEEGRLERLAQVAPCEVARSLPLADLAVRLSTCSVFVGHDSGISHLAAAVGVPSIVLWGDSAEAVWRPLGDHVTLLRNLAEIPVETVFNAVQSI